MQSGENNEYSGADAVIVGVPAHATSISPTNSHQTPAAIRAALSRYSLAHSAPSVDLGRLQIFDSGDVISPDVDENQTISALRSLHEKNNLLIV